MLNMNIRLNPRSREAIYLQIVSQIKHLVISGQLEIGAQLPTVRKLAENLDLNPNTIVRAYNKLIQEGVIAAQQGRGTYIYQAPLDSGNRKTRRERLIAEMDAFLHEADRFDPTADELEKIWRDRFSRWRKSRTETHR